MQFVGSTAGLQAAAGENNAHPAAAEGTHAVQQQPVAPRSEQLQHGELGAVVFSIHREGSKFSAALTAREGRGSFTALLHQVLWLLHQFARL